MKLIDLVEQCANFRNIFEINQQNNDWDTYDTVWDDSPLLKPYLENEIHSLTAIKEDVFRFTLVMDDDDKEDKKMIK